MIAIEKPIPCKKCGELIDTYSINKTTNKIDFKCHKCKKIMSLTEYQYSQFLRNGEI